MVALSPRDLETAVWQHINHALDALRDSETPTTGFDRAEPRHVLARFAGLAQALLEPHRVNDDGQCTTCRNSTAAISASVPCPITALAGLYLLDDLPVVWWHILNHQGQAIALDQIRLWLDSSRHER